LINIIRWIKELRIKNLETGIEKATNVEIEVLKKEKLHLKDEIFNLLKSKA